MSDEDDNDQDTLKETLLETNPYLLGLTIIISILHSVFEFLAFKNGKETDFDTYSQIHVIVLILFHNPALRFQIFNSGITAIRWKVYLSDPYFSMFFNPSSSCYTFWTMKQTRLFASVALLVYALKSGRLTKL